MVAMWRRLFAIPVRSPHRKRVLMRRFGLVLLLILCSLPCCLRAESHVVRAAPGVDVPVVATVPAKLGESSVELVGPWKFRTGDNPAWSEPDFDDSNWS